ncbi:hypothetical protein V8C26DRAFT_340861 [Trichoderma gracile]
MGEGKELVFARAIRAICAWLDTLVCPNLGVSVVVHSLLGPWRLIYFLLSCLRCHCFSLLCPWPFTLFSIVIQSRCMHRFFLFFLLFSLLCLFFLVPSFLF